MFRNSREDWARYFHDGYKQLACGILYEAMDAWQKYGTVGPEQTGGFLARGRFSQAYRRCLLADELDFDSPRQEMLAFFNDPWFYRLCDMADVSAELILQKLGLGGFTSRGIQ